MALAAIDEVLGWDGAALTSYIATLAQSHLDVIEGNAVASHLLGYLKYEGDWSPSELPAKLEERFGDHSRPVVLAEERARLGGRPDAVEPALRGFSCEYREEQRTKHSRICSVKRVSIPEG